MKHKKTDSHTRSIVKTFSYRLIGAFVTATVAGVLTGQIHTALSVGAIDTLVKIGVYYGHERLWNRLSFGLAKEPEYNI
ncbi:MAG TPA: DUF2061 domain-containing protein [Candidatus Brocadiia bacterium]|nr:DUF2061 domain-containing protein [Candidatus Brocadiia bacterium]